MKETDLYLPVKQILTDDGYTVMSEVNNIDLVALKDDCLVIVELKTAFTLKLILQAVQRQKLSENVYIAIPKPKFKKAFGKDFRDKQLLLKRLGLGLIFVSLTVKKPYAQIILEPKLYNLNKSRAQNKRKKLALLNEFNRRHADHNLGGTNGKIITAYREDALLIASYLEENGAMKPKALKSLGTCQNTTNILYQNHYGWFERVSRGVYALSEQGINEIEDYRHIISHLK